MAQATVELRKLLTLNNFDLFDFETGIDDPIFEQELKQAITDYFYFHEIGSPTVDQFKHRFQSKFKRIIGFYNKLYNTTLLEYNPLINYSINEALDQLATSNNTQDTTTNSTANGESTADNTQTTEQTTTGEGNTKNSDYPQQSIAGGDYLNGEQVTTSTDNIDSTINTNATATNNDTTSTTGSLTGNETVNTEYSKTIEGLTGISYQELIQKERENILRIPTMVINELKSCFILVY